MSVTGLPKYPYDLFLFFSFALILFLSGPVDARTGHSRRINHQNYIRNKGYKIYNPKPVHGSSSFHGYNAYEPYNRIFDVLSFGAKGDGIADDSKAFLAAWAEACSVGSATVEIPSEFRFLVGPITLQGPCKPGLALQIDGIILAPGDLGIWPKSGLLQWLNFKNLQSFTIQGTGTIDGQGSAWWAIPRFQLNKAVRFYSSYSITIRDIRIQNSPLCHLKFDNCAGVKVSNLTISSPGDSPNTDGIHIQNSQEVEVQYSSISCGDDCISIQTGSSNIYIHHIQCGPGHGISIGGLGNDGSLACVSNITVQNTTMQDTLYGVRIKTWQGGLGSVKSVSFSNIQVSNVKIPIAIDQFYCDKKACTNKTNAVAISDINYDRINGTYSTQVIYLACSSSIPCINIGIANISLVPSAEAGELKQALCWNTYGKSQAPLLPTSIDCLETSNPYKNTYRLNKTSFTC
ncbi:polygalacturonase At1g48100-like [Tasmannia lanceolata]|uniref:polygalacturonase At1g48100-like n=1 Tax=Tasmannia lanceolata TaxID=3420 RepID=UPI004064A7AA